MTQKTATNQQIFDYISQIHVKSEAKLIQMIENQFQKTENEARELFIAYRLQE